MCFSAFVFWMLTGYIIAFSPRYIKYNQENVEETDCTKLPPGPVVLTETDNIIEWSQYETANYRSYLF